VPNCEFDQAQTDWGSVSLSAQLAEYYYQLTGKLGGTDPGPGAAIVGSLRRNAGRLSELKGRLR